MKIFYALFIFMWVIVSSAAELNAVENISFTGRIGIYSLDENDKITALVIENENESLIIVGRKRLELVPFIGTLFSVIGIPGIDENGEKTIEILSYQNKDEEKEKN